MSGDLLRAARLNGTNFIRISDNNEHYPPSLLTLYDVIAGCSLVSGLEPSSRGELRERLSRGLSLTHLDLTDCQRLDDLSLRLILQASSGMENLYLRRCSNITG